MSTTITMPQLGETVTEGTVAQWLKKVGDTVEKYEPFVEVSTDKVNAEVPSPVSGTIREFIVKEGETVPTGAPIAIIDEIGAASVTAPAHTPSPSEQVADHARAVPSSYGAGGTMEAVRQGCGDHSARRFARSATTRPRTQHRRDPRARNGQQRPRYGKRHRRGFDRWAKCCGRRRDFQ